MHSERTVNNDSSRWRFQITLAIVLLSRSLFCDIIPLFYAYRTIKYKKHCYPRQLCHEEESDESEF